jgi:hypothetical protein
MPGGGGIKGDCFSSIIIGKEYNIAHFLIHDGDLSSRTQYIQVPRLSSMAKNLRI